MSGTGSCYDDFAVKTFLKTIKAELIWRKLWYSCRDAEMAIFEYVNGFNIRGGGTQHWDRKIPSLSNGQSPKRACGAARKRDRAR